jgi:hypothetical protein
MSTDDDALNTRRQVSSLDESRAVVPTTPAARLPEKYWIVEYNLPPGFVRHSRDDGQYVWTRDFRVGYPNSFVKYSIHVAPEIEKNIIQITVVDVERDSAVLHRSKVTMISKTSDWRQRLAQRLGPILVKANNKCRREPQAPLPSTPEYSALSDALLPGFRYQGKTETETAYWIQHPNKSSNLVVKVYPNLAQKTVSIKVFYEGPTNTAGANSNTESPSQVEIAKWSHEVSMTGGDTRWKTTLAERLGEASVQAKKQPKCPTCKKPAVLRSARYGQFFGCSSFPRCRGSLSIGDFQTELPQVFFDQQGQQQDIRARAA